MHITRAPSGTDMSLFSGHPIPMTDHKDKFDNSLGSPSQFCLSNRRSAGTRGVVHATPFCMLHFISSIKSWNHCSRQTRGLAMSWKWAKQPGGRKDRRVSWIKCCGLLNLCTPVDACFLRQQTQTHFARMARILNVVETERAEGLGLSVLKPTNHNIAVYRVKAAIAQWVQIPQGKPQHPSTTAENRADILVLA